MSHALLQAWEKVLRRHGHRRAVVEAASGCAVTFRELDAAAAAWRAAQVPDPAQLAGRAVVFAVPNGIAWLNIFLGLLKAGAVAVPLDPGEPVAAQQRVAGSLRAGAWWDGRALVPLAAARRYRDPETCLIKVTSGSTGRPRALVFAAAQMLADGRQVTATMGITARDRNYALIPLGHSYGLGNLTIPLLAQGVPLVCGTAALPQAIAEDFARWRPTVFPGVPAMWRALAASEVWLPHLRLAISAGAPLAPEVARDFAARFGRSLHSFYGSSETGGIAYDRTGRATLAGRVGTAMRGVELTALSGQRLRVSSAAVTTRGGARRPDGPGAWIMPDRVELGPRGEVTLLGRRGTTVKVAGRRVNLAEVAERLRRLPGVREAWVGLAGGPDAVLAAVVATEQTPADLRATLLPLAAAWTIPKKLVTVAALPVTARGKTDVRALQALIS
ncbi:MAG TPA: class I adenylate-forming enzyme family protein [Lacunisphaera sp.]|nr:class I adenylate-forming enzyme family protein [Lacunisphaera sp.]